MRLLVTGNSHTAALHGAWERIGKAHPDIEVTYFTAPNRVFDTFRVDPETGEFGLSRDADQATVRYKATTRLNARPRIAFGDFDRIVVAGAHFGLRFALQLMVLVRVDGLEGCGKSGARGLMSQNVFREMLRDLATQYCELLDGFPKGTAVVPLYRPADGIASREGPTAKIWRRLQRLRTDLHAMLGLFYEIADEQVSAKGLSLIRQPERTISESGLTRAEFAEGGRQIAWKGAEPEPADDRVHLNADFGEIVWGEILERIGKSAAASQEA